MPNLDDIQRIRKIYSTLYNPNPSDRGNLWHPRNPVSIYFRQAQERAIIDIFNRSNLSLETLQILDVGCGSGGLLRFFASLGVPPGRLHGLDLMPIRIELARELCPAGIHLQVGNAETLPYPDSFFDLVCQFTVFSSIFDLGLRSRIASEMARTLKQGGHILWYDARVGNSKTTQGIDTHQIQQLFPGCRIVWLCRLHPPYATRLARRSIFLCEILDRVPLVKKTHILALIQKPH